MNWATSRDAQELLHGTESPGGTEPVHWGSLRTDTSETRRLGWSPLLGSRAVEGRCGRPLTSDRTPLSVWTLSRWGPTVSSHHYSSIMDTMFARCSFVLAKKFRRNAVFDERKLVFCYPYQSWSEPNFCYTFVGLSPCDGSS